MNCIRHRYRRFENHGALKILMRDYKYCTRCLQVKEFPIKTPSNKTRNSKIKRSVKFLKNLILRLDLLGIFNKSKGT